MATLKNTTINDTGFVTVPSGTTAQRPTTPTVTTSTTRPILVSQNGLRLFITSVGALTSSYWATYTNLPAYLTGLPSTTIINSTDAGTFTINLPARVYMLRSPSFNVVDLTGWTLLESGRSYINVIPNDTVVYFRDFAAGTHALDDNSAMYMWDFGSGITGRNGQLFYNTDLQVLQDFNVLGWNNSLVTSGLVCYLDAGRLDSYPGFGPIIKDLTGSGRIGQMSGSWSYSDTWDGVIQLNASSGSIRVPDINLVSGPYTVMGASRYTGATRGRIITSLSNNWLLGHWSTTTLNYFAEGWVTTVGAGPSDTNWRIYAGTGGVANNYAFYANNVLLAGPNNNGTQGPNGFNIGGGSFGEWSDGQFGFLLCYNRILSAAEMTQNYNFFRNRYGL